MSKRPNFLILLADDLGFSDPGCYGGEIKTPNIDRLAKEGVRMTNFHTASACSPTRAMLLSGTDNHLNGLGGMIEAKARVEGQRHDGKPGHEGYLLDTVCTLPELLKDAGYHTILTGKWHLGNDPHQTPRSRGFDRDYGFMWGCHNHYAYEPQFNLSNPDDGVMGKWLKGVVTKLDMYTLNGEWIDEKANFPKTDGGFYSTDTFTSHLLNFLDERQKTPELKTKPFFAYHAYTAPHFPLQAPKEMRDKYKGMYDEGPEALRLKRLAKLRELGLVGEEIEPHKVENPWGLKFWREMSDEERAKSARAMETYAAMVEMIDTSVGRILDKLEADGELDNTMIIFMSDNGAEGAACEAYPVVGPSIMRSLQRWYNNDLDNIGEPDSFVWYGSFWAQASTAPSRLWKMMTSQGGIRVPCVVRYPPIRSAHPAGSIANDFSTCMDIMPTMLDLGGATHSTTYKGRTVLPLNGKSWVGWLDGKDKIHETDMVQGWELHGRAAYRQGNWKLLWMPKPFGTGQWELFDLSKDPGENTDLASEQPERLEKMLEGWDKYVVDNGVIWGMGGNPDPSTNPKWAQDETDDPKAWMGVGKKA